MRRNDWAAWSRQRACVVCGDELPPAHQYASWLCPECLVASDADTTRPRPVDFAGVLGVPAAG